MIEFIEILIISVLQGIGEFLPISSSGHNAVANSLFSLYGKPLTEGSADFIKLNVLLHLGTLFAVIIVFRQRIIDLLTKDQHLIALLIVGTIPGVAVGLVVKKTCPWIEENLWIIGSCFVGTGILLLVSLRAPQGEKTCSTMSFLDALLIGCVQGVAVLPGLSRSGSTIVAGLFRKLRRDEAATFSFLLSIPIIGGGGLMELKDLLKPDESGPGSSLPLWLLITGMFASCLVGIIALLWVIDWLKKGRLWYFAVWVFVMCPFTFYLAGTPAKVTVPAKVVTDLRAAESVDDDEPALRINMPREEALQEYEKIRAEEEAKELALIEEEKKRLPLVGQPETLISLDPNDRIWLTENGKSVVLLGRIAQRERMLELFACRIGSKEHESIVSIRVKPHLIHAALIMAGAEPGKPVQMRPTFVPPSGDEIEIKVRWRDVDSKEGEFNEVFAQDWVFDNAKSTEAEPQSMSTHWVFTGSMFYKTEEGEEHYIADDTGELFGLSNFVGAILDVPIQSSEANDDLLFSCFTERIPEIGTPLTLILTPVKNKR